MSYSRRKIVMFTTVVFSALIVWLVSETIFNIKGHFQGIYLLTGRDNHRWVLKDDLFLGDGPRVIASLTFDPLRRFFRTAKMTSNGQARLEIEWDEENGSGFITNIFSDNTAIQTFFSRFTDEHGLEAKGLFVGGGEASTALKLQDKDLNNTGMTYYNGQRWLHVWCNVNESIVTYAPKFEAILPSSWHFIDSKILINNADRVIVRSRHEVMIDNVSLRIERFAYFRAGSPFFNLGINITNEGTRPVRYAYMYGDEPWVGDFGSSSGNIGWAKGRIFPYESIIDTKQETYAGIIDSDERIANFIEWFGSFRPNNIYISNQNGQYSEIEKKVPLVSNERYIGMSWGPRIIKPGETNRIYLAIGMAPIDPTTGIPVKPDIPLSDFLLSTSNNR